MEAEQRASRIRELIDQYRRVAEIERAVVAELFHLMATDDALGRKHARFGHGDAPGPADRLWMNCWRYDSDAHLERLMAAAIAPFGMRLLELDAPSLTKVKD